MNCTATNKTFRRQRLHDEGMKTAIRKCSLYLDCVMSDKMRWSKERIRQIHSTFNRLAEDVQSGKLTTEQMIKTLKEEHGANVCFRRNEERPGFLYSDYINGVHDTTDKISVILLYLFIHIYGMGEAKTNALMAGINETAKSVNLGYVTEKELQECLADEEGIQVERLKDVG